MHGSSDIVCLSHLHWRWVFQRPQHLMTRAARTRRVLYFEEPAVNDIPPEGFEGVIDGVTVVTPPAVPAGASPEDVVELQRAALEDALERHGFERPVLWYYTPMAVAFTAHLDRAATVYDCMDELSAFNEAPPELLEREAELFGTADLVFTGGRSLYEAKRGRHASVHLFPSSIDVDHFGAARRPHEDPAAQAAIPRPRLGWAGAVDERLDLDLLAGLADARPDWQIVIVGPAAHKIDRSALPERPNLHWMGPRPYGDLPAHFAGWDVGIMPFALNRATEYISPTKTLEYLAAGLPVVSTPVPDVVAAYGDLDAVRIATGVDGWVTAVEGALRDGRTAARPEVDAFLARDSWDATWRRMGALVDAAVAARQGDGVDDLPSLEGATR